MIDNTKHKEHNFLIMPTILNYKIIPTTAIRLRRDDGDTSY
jgi:hypothetical protein